jgi:GDP-4-dehydro-6-deoxy-D-mannose reductase
MRALVTGADGFVGRHLVKFLVDKGYEICASDCYFRSDNLYPDNVVKKELDITDKGILYQVLGEFKPDEIYHLAGIAATTGQDRERYYQVNFQGTLNLLETLRERAQGARLLYVGSSNVYGSVPPTEQPITEERCFAPINHYAASKAAGDAAAYAYAQEGLHIIRGRPFNHTGPGQNTDFVCSRLAKLIAEIASGLAEPLINAGNLDTRRDFTDVRDIVRAYWLLLQRGLPGEVYNICSEKAYSVRQIVNMLAELGQVKIELYSRPELQRKNDIPLLLGSAGKLRRDTDWRPEIPLRQTLSDLLQCWQEIIHFDGKKK